MATLTFDTYEFIKQLMRSGIPKEQAEAHVSALTNISLSHMSTKEDVRQLELRISELKYEILKWIIPLLLAQTAVFATLVKWAA